LKSGVTEDAGYWMLDTGTYKIIILDELDELDKLTFVIRNLFYRASQQLLSFYECLKTIADLNRTDA
jgi:hypothetical protein